MVHLVQVLDIDCLLSQIGSVGLSTHAIVSLEITKTIILIGSWSWIAKDIIKCVCSVLLDRGSSKVEQVTSSIGFGNRLLNWL